MYQDIRDYIYRLTRDLTSALGATSSASDTEDTGGVPTRCEQESKGNDATYSASVVYAQPDNTLLEASDSPEITRFLETDDHLENQGDEAKFDARPAELDERTWERSMNTLHRLAPDVGKALENKVYRAKVIKVYRRHEEGSGESDSVLVKRKPGKGGKIVAIVSIPCAILVLGLCLLCYATRHRRITQERNVAQRTDFDMEPGLPIPPRSEQGRGGRPIRRQ